MFFFVALKRFRSLTITDVIGPNFLTTATTQTLTTASTQTQPMCDENAVPKQSSSSQTPYDTTILSKAAEEVPHNIPASATNEAHTDITTNGGLQNQQAASISAKEPVSDENRATEYLATSYNARAKPKPVCRYYRKGACRHGKSRNILWNNQNASFNTL